MSALLKADSLALWRAARDFEPNGVNRETAGRLLQKDGQALYDHLFRMTQAGYLARVGPYGQGMWRIGNRVPTGEQLAPPADAPAPAPAPAPSPAAQPSKPRAQATDDHDDGDSDSVDRREPVKGVLPGVPNSVFALGSMAAQAPADATPPDFTARAPAPAAAAGLSSWKPAKPLVASAEPTPAATDHQAPPPAVLKTFHEVAQQPAPPAQGLPVFQLHSDGSFVIAYSDFPGHHVRLQPDATRAMFSFLDRIGGLDLTRLVTEPEATS